MIHGLGARANGPRVNYAFSYRGAARAVIRGQTARSFVYARSAGTNPSTTDRITPLSKIFIFTKYMISFLSDNEITTKLLKYIGKNYGKNMCSASLSHCPSSIRRKQIVFKKRYTKPSFES